MCRRSKRIVSHGRTDGGHVLFADIQQLRQEEVRAAVAQLPGSISAQPDLLLRHSTTRDTVRPPGADIHHAAVQPPGVDQDGPDESRGSRPKAGRAKGMDDLLRKGRSRVWSPGTRGRLQTILEKEGD